MKYFALILTASTTFGGCGGGAGGTSFGDGGTMGTTTTSESSSTTASNGEAATAADTTAVSSDAGDTAAMFDLGGLPDFASPTPVCTVQDEGNAPGACGVQSPPDSFTPEVQWAWAGDGDDVYSIVTPLVANLTDDDGNGVIDLCDTPDIVVIAHSVSGTYEPGHIYVLDGATGSQHYRIDTAVSMYATPAVGDIDGDGAVEIVAVTVGGGGLAAFEHDGALKWTIADAMTSDAKVVALADLDNDGDVEISVNGYLFDHEGAVVPGWEGGLFLGFPAIADLDGDGDLEVAGGPTTFHHDGTASWTIELEGVPSNLGGFTHVGNLDDDDDPEILVTNHRGLTLLDHDGTIQYQGLRPTGVIAGGNFWLRPATIHDFDGDGVAEFAMSSATNYTTYRADGSIMWSAQVQDPSGVAGGTAFDFLGDGQAEALYADEHQFFAFDALGAPLFAVPRTSGTAIEYPVVADVDNDGSAEIVVVSNRIGEGEASSPPVQVIRDADDRWVQARRIWNQHAYHVTNVLEDGTIPQFEAPSWLELNTFRTNAQIEGGLVCDPEPPG